MNGISDATRKRLLDVVIDSNLKQDIEVDEMKVIMEHIDVKKPHHSSKFSTADSRHLTPCVTGISPTQRIYQRDLVQK